MSLFEEENGKYVYRYTEKGTKKKIECDDLHRLILYAIRK